MRLKVILFYITSLTFIVASEPTWGQKNKKKYTTKSIAVEEDSSHSYKLQFQLSFSNINKVKYYYNAAELSKIKKLEEKKDYAALLPVLEAYVENFGIQNFAQSTTLIWKLAQLYEVLGERQKAISTYKLVLKHHRGDEIRSIVQHYDDVTNSKEQNSYVPLEDYYELVEYRKAVDTLRPPRSVFLNMGELVNDKKYPDYGPALNVNNDILLFTKRKKEISNTKLSYRENEELYYSKNYDGFWDEAIPFSNLINTHCNEGSACLSRDGKTLYFSRCRVLDYQYDCRDCMGACDLYVSYLTKDSTWTVAKNLGVNVNTISWESHPTLSHTEDTLYFASDRISGFGLSDIYFTYKTANNSWAPAQNLGPIINTRANEVSPFYHPAHKVFYFSSNGQLLNFGVHDTIEYHFKTVDIYRSLLINGQWSEPRNIGPLVNGAGEEYYFTIDAKSKDLFYARSEAGDEKNLDLFSFPLPMEAQPTANTKFSGSLRDSISGNPFKGIVSIIDLSNGIEVAPKFIRPDGTYEFDLIDDNDYLLVIQGDDFFRVEKKFHLEGDTNIDMNTPSLKYNRWKFQSIEFEGGSSEILPEMNSDLDKVVNFLLDNPTFKLKISGHTDSDGDANLNLRLSQKRAEAIKNYIVEKGQIDVSRVEANGYGNQKPIVEERSDLDKKINRRVEFEIIRPLQNNDQKENGLQEIE